MYYTCKIKDPSLRIIYYRLLQALGFTPTLGLRYNTLEYISFKDDFICNNIIKGSTLIDNPHDFLEMAINHSINHKLI
jgi:hypothetical protein|nr:MAG TPA: hypothetical protein [Crassvirales sp.]